MPFNVHYGSSESERERERERACGREREREWLRNRVTEGVMGVRQRREMPQSNYLGERECVCEEERGEGEKRNCERSSA